MAANFYGSIVESSPKGGMFQFSPEDVKTYLPDPFAGAAPGHKDGPQASFSRMSPLFELPVVWGHSFSPGLYWAS